MCVFKHATPTYIDVYVRQRSVVRCVAIAPPTQEELNELGIYSPRHGHLVRSRVPGRLRLCSLPDGAVYLGKTAAARLAQLLQEPHQPHRDQHGTHGEVARY